MFGGVALSSATPKTCPTCAAVTVRGIGAGITWACGGAPGACRSKTCAEGPLGSMKVWSPGSAPGATCAGCGAPEKPVTMALPGANMPGDAFAPRRIDGRDRRNQDRDTSQRTGK